MPDSFTQKPPSDQPIREVDIELCFVCKKCRLAFTGESPLLTHQRQCFGGGQENNRGAYRIVQIAYECRVCPTITTEKFKSPSDLMKHCDSEVHQKNIKNSLTTSATSSVNSAIISKNSGNGGAVPPESPLSHEMEDVVNQITLLAARAAQESIPDRGGSNNLDTNSNTFCSPGEPKRRFLSPADVATSTAAQQQQPLTTGGH